jgi:HTH-type transcriptional regulator, sugar sensing transcriptional regulator
MEIQKELESLGFTTNEVKVYLVLLRLGKSKAGRIAKECSLERTSAYNALNRLLMEGMASYFIESNTKTFKAVEPEKIAHVFKEKQERASLLVPELNKLKGDIEEKENIQKFKGYNGIKTVFNDMLKSCKKGDYILSFGTEKQLYTRMTVFARIFDSRIKEKQIHLKILKRQDQKPTHPIKDELRELRYLPDDFSFPSNILLYKEKVAIIIWSENPEALILDDPLTASSFKHNFEFLWKSAKK